MKISFVGLKRKANPPRIRRVTPEKLGDVIERRIPLGLFLAREGGRWVAVDNRDGDAWTEDFCSKRQAICWLRDESVEADTAKSYGRISGAAELIIVAKKQGMELSTSEASLLLGYLEGHDYCLMANADGRTMRHDEADGKDHRGDEPYSLLDTIIFCQEMNEDLISDLISDEKRLAELRKDEQAIDALMARVTQEEVELCVS